jgi:hypothetical protein
MSERRRWDIDERFVGVADAAASAPDIERLLTQATATGWITEDAEAHLGWHLRAAADALGLSVTRLEVVDDVLELEVHAPDDHDWGRRQVDAFGLAGSIAEDSTHVRMERHKPREMAIEVLTGVLPGDGTFATHGHLVRIRVTGEG